MRVGRVAAIGVLVLAGAAFAAFEAGGGTAGLARWRAAWRLRHGAKDARIAAARDLVERPDPRLLPALTAALDDEEKDVRSCALWALGVLGDPRAAPAVRRRLESEDPEELRYAVFAAGQLRDEAAIPRLVAAADRSSGRTRH